MNQIEYLLQQAARAERLATTIMDKLTVERLQAFASECRAQAKTLDETTPRAQITIKGSIVAKLAEVTGA